MTLNIDHAKPVEANVEAALSAVDRWRGRYREAGLSVLLALQVMTMFVVSPLAGTGVFSAETVEALRFGLAATAILIVNRSRAVGAFVALTFIASLGSAVFIRTGASGEAGIPADVMYFTNIAFSIIFELAVCWTVARAVFEKGKINVHRIMGAVILYLYIGLIFASLYRLGASFLHPSFLGLSGTRRGDLSQLLYFSLSTLTTSGAGTVVPMHPFLRSLANLETVIGQFYLATFVARLVTLHGADMPEPPGKGRG